MDFENLFSKPPNPALGKRPASDPDKRIHDELDDTEVEEAQEEKIKWKVKLECEQIPKKRPNEYSPHPPYSPDLALVQFLAPPKSPYDYKRHFGNSATSPKSLPYRKSRSKDYESYSDNDTCSQEPENNFEKELQKYIRAKELANAVQLLPSSKESMTKEGVKATKLSAKPKHKNLKPGHKNGKQKKMKRKRPGTGNKEPDALLQKSSPQGEDGAPKEKQQHVRMSQGFINQHTVERKGKKVCKYFLERKCIKGDQCKFDHDAEMEKKKEMYEYPCKFYHTGTKCYQGEHCRFSHAPLTTETQELLAKVLDAEKKTCK